MKKLLTFFILPFLLACESSKEPDKILSHIAEFDSTDGRYSELIVSKKVTPDYDVDDFVMIGTARNALSNHAQSLFNANKAPKKSNGLRDESGLQFLFGVMTKQYKMRRISDSEVERVSFFTTDPISRATVIDTLNDTVNKKGERINVPIYIERRLKHDRHKIFGEIGSEVWFGGKRDDSFETLSAFWDSVLVKEPSNISQRDAMKRSYPIHFLKKYRVFRMLDIADSTAQTLTLPDTTSLKRQQKLILSASDSTLVSGKDDTRKLKTFSFNSNSKTK